MQNNKDYFEEYLDKFTDLPSLVLLRSVQAKNIPISFLRQSVLDLCCGDVFSLTLGLKNISGCDISESVIEVARAKEVCSDLKVCDVRKLPFWI